MIDKKLTIFKNLTRYAMGGISELVRGEGDGFCFH